MLGMRLGMGFSKLHRFLVLSEWQREKRLLGFCYFFYRLSSSFLVVMVIFFLFSFWTYEVSKRVLHTDEDSEQHRALKVLLCGGLAGVATWASIFPLGESFFWFFFLFFLALSFRLVCG